MAPLFSEQLLLVIVFYIYCLFPAITIVQTRFTSRCFSTSRITETLEEVKLKEECAFKLELGVLLTEAVAGSCSSAATFSGRSQAE